MRIRRIVACSCIFASASAAAQLTGSFYLEKTTFARGEPIFLYLSLMNKGPDTAEFAISDPDQPLCSGISITVSNDPSGAFCPQPRDEVCSLDGQFQNLHLLSGQTHTLRFLLNFHHEIDAPGDYWVDAKYNGSPITSAETHTTVGETHARLAFRVGAEPITSSEWKPWVEQLQSPESEERQEAAKTLASLAPPSLEEILLGFANSAEFRKYSPMAFHRLNNRRSIEALAQFMEGPATEEQIEAAQYLAETNDQRWYPLLRDAAEKNARNSAYPTYAAELGGEKMLPLLVALEKTPDTFTRLNAVAAMGATRSRAAIPTLLDQLKNPDADINDRASYGLMVLTHRTALQDSPSRNRAAEYIKWSRWWEREGATAPIYGGSECAELLPLP
jgi:hypothetical protein